MDYSSHRPIVPRPWGCDTSQGRGSYFTLLFFEFEKLEQETCFGEGSGGNTTGTPPLTDTPPPFFSARSAGKFFYLGNPQ